MLKKLAFLALSVAFAASLPPSPSTRTIVDEGTVPNSQLTSNPCLITGVPLPTQVCYNNLPGNYQNPFNCSQVLMCANTQVFVGWPLFDGIYNPIPDMFVYKPTSPDQETCPWPSIWKDLKPEDPETRCVLGQHPFWGIITFPLYPKVNCGEDIYYCRNSAEVAPDTPHKCSRGAGYSKAYLGCLEYNKCLEVDGYFGLLV